MPCAHGNSRASYIGHSQVQTTARYAHLVADPVKVAAERVTSNIASVLNGALAQDEDTDAASA